ncbi:MAG: AEC family transporter [Saccharofermentanales bacterium]
MNAGDLAIIMCLLILVGYVSRKRDIVDENFGRNLSRFIFDIVFPAIIINSMSISFDKKDLYNSGILILISTGSIILMFFVGTGSKFITRKKDSLSQIITFALMFPNFTFMAFPVMELLFPEKGLFYISMFTIPTRFAIYILGPLLMKPEEAGENRLALIKSGLKSLLSPPVLAIPIGLLIYFTGISLPMPVSETISYLAKVATPMGMAVSGIMMADVSLRNLFGEPRLYLLTVLRLLVAPVLVFFILAPFNLDPVILKISVIFCALPIASSTTIFAVQFKGDAPHAAGGVFLTTAFSMITVPICAYILELVV